ncbi:MAG: hypothetical protein QF735_08260, partial [Phycisphaeraceae bacterium]|nr:hypothetical protein [Phycisphaeraceae bacterium]
DIEQFQYLMKNKKIDARYEETVSAYTDLLENFPENPDDPHASPIPVAPPVITAIRPSNRVM